MPRAPRYKMTTDGKIRDLKKGIDIFVKSFEVVKSGRFEIVKIEPNAGKKLRIARYSIDEKEYSLGPAKASATPGGARQKPSEEDPILVRGGETIRTESQAVAVRRNITISLTREEAMKLVKTFRALEVVLTTELIGETMESGK